MGARAVTTLTPEQIRRQRIAKEHGFYKSELGFLDFVRDCGAAPNAQQQPHGRFCQDIIQWKGEPDPEAPERMIYRWKLILWPRGSFKSSVFDVGYVCWLIANDPNVRILVCSETGKQARDFVAKAMDIIDSEWFKERFGVHRKQTDWRPGSGRFTSAQRTRTEIREPTLQATGVGEVRTGMHWDVVIMDDVCSQENTRTPESIESLWNWFGETLAQLDPGCRLLVIGTLHHYADIYCRIQKTSEIRKLFEISIFSWRSPPGDPKEDNGGELFFPGRLTRRFVQQQKAVMPPRLFACFYENRPTTGEEQIFLPSYFRVIGNDQVPHSVWTYIFSDFAFIAEERKKGKADRTVFWVVALDVNRVAYVLDFWVGRWKPSDSVRLACKLWDDHQWANVKGITIEDTAHKELLSSLFEEIRRQTFTQPRIIPISGRSQEVKEMRIEACEPRFRRGDIYVTQRVRDQRRKWDALFAEMTEWPFSEHDDIPDAISDIDKRDKDGRLYCPGPPPGWRSQQAIRHQPAMIDGRYNPNIGHPARESIRREAELWTLFNQGAETQKQQNQSIFRRRSNPDSLWRK